MAIPRPKILTAFTVPTGGWTLHVDISDAAQYDITVQATVAAGDYFVSWDNQSDDFLKALADALNNALDASAAAWITNDDAVVVYLDSDHKVNIQFDQYFTSTHQDVKIKWTAGEGSDIAGVLGFDGSADDAQTGGDDPLFTADWHHAYGWYADTDGILAGDMAENADHANALQSVAPSGHVKTHYVGGRQTNELQLQHVPRHKMLSADVGYTVAPVHPSGANILSSAYARNEPLQCWWKEARQGIRFRVYRDAHVDTAKASDQGEMDAATDATTLTDAAKSWATEPQRWAGRILYVDNWSKTDAPGKWHIASNTATVLTVTAASGTDLPIDDNADKTYHLFDHDYDTYVLDMERMKKFAPMEIPNIDKYNLTIPLMRYEA